MFSLVIKPVTIRLLLSLAISSHQPLHQFDMQNAFLHGDLEEDVYMKQHIEFVHLDMPSYVCKLKKPIYGLKQAPQAQFAKLSDRLFSFGFWCSALDSSLFILRTVSTCIFILVYIDDIIITGSSSKLIYEFIQSLGSYFPIQNLGLLHLFLGIKVTRTANSMFLSQCKYITDILISTNMHNSKSITTPMSTSKKLFSFDGCIFEDPQQYCSVVGSLQYLAFTRPDISFVANCVCQYMHIPRVLHWKAIKCILRYLNHTRHFSLHFSVSSSFTLSAFFYVDQAGCLMIVNSHMVLVSTLVIT